VVRATFNIFRGEILLGWCVPLSIKTRRHGVWLRFCKKKNFLPGVDRPVLELESPSVISEIKLESSLRRRAGDGMYKWSPLIPPVARSVMPPLESNRWIMLRRGVVCFSIQNSWIVSNLVRGWSLGVSRMSWLLCLVGIPRGSVSRTGVYRRNSSEIAGDGRLPSIAGKMYISSVDLFRLPMLMDVRFWVDPRGRPEAECSSWYLSVGAGPLDRALSNSYPGESMKNSMVPRRILL
jgi:hypothetical protein